MDDDGIHFLTKTTIQSVEKLPSNMLRVTFNTGHVEEFSHVFAAIGRVGNSDRLGLQNTTIKVKRQRRSVTYMSLEIHPLISPMLPFQVGQNGFIPSDDFENTNVKGVYRYVSIEMCFYFLNWKVRKRDQSFSKPSILTLLLFESVRVYI
jgi:pyruvate/2-oxoglutarate dehydrogenase complex dihydrolipoamide dehydrogenase (E3) component